MLFFFNLQLFNIFVYFKFQTAYNLLQYEVYSSVFPELLNSSTGASVILHLWHVNPSLLLRGFIDAFSMDSSNMIKVLELCHELKVYSIV